MDTKGQEQLFQGLREGTVATGWTIRGDFPGDWDGCLFFFQFY